MTAGRDAIAFELEQAAALMTRRERALGDALIDLVGAIGDAGEFLAMIADPAAPDFDAGHALVADEVRRQLREACTAALGAHAAAVADALESLVH